MDENKFDVVNGVLAMVAPKLSLDNYAAMMKCRSKDYGDAIITRAAFIIWYEKEPASKRLEYLQQAMKKNRKEAARVSACFQSLFNMDTKSRREWFETHPEFVQMQRVPFALYEEYNLINSMSEQVLPSTLTTTCKTYQSPHANETMDYLLPIFQKLPEATTRKEIIKVLHDAMVFLRLKDTGISPPSPSPFNPAVSSPPSSPHHLH